MLHLLFFAVVGAIHAAPVTALAFSPDGSTLAAAAGSKVKLLTAADGKLLGVLTCDDMRATAVAFQPNGDLLAVGVGLPGEKGVVKLMDWRNRRWLTSADSNADVVSGVAFSPDGTLLASSSADGSAQLWDVAKLMPILRLTGHTAAIHSIKFSPDGTMLLTASADRSLKVWSSADGKMLRSFGQHTDAVHALAFRPATPDRADTPPYCASGGDDRTVRVWQPTIGRMVRIVRGHDGPVLALAFTPDGRSLFSAGQEGVIRRIDAESDVILGDWRGSDDWIYSLAVSPDGRMLAVGDWAGSIHRWTIGAKTITPCKTDDNSAHP